MRGGSVKIVTTGCQGSVVVTKMELTKVRGWGAGGVMAKVGKRVGNCNKRDLFNDMEKNRVFEDGAKEQVDPMYGQEGRVN